MQAVIFDIDETMFGAGNTLQEGLADLLALLHRLGLKLAAVSADDHRSLVRLEEAGIKHYFSSILCSAYTNEPKTPAGIKRLLTELQAEPHHVALVSQAHRDIHLGKEIGLKTIGVSSGSHTDKLRQAGADHVVSDMPSVLDVLE